MKALIISIGDELLIGQTVNTNAAFIADELNKAGINVSAIYTIGDKREDIFYALHNSAKNAEITIITGGLGPTNDDITKKTLSEFFSSPLVLNESSLKNIEALFSRHGWALNEINRKQAELPKNCIPLKNELGTAPGMWFTENGKHYISLPGVPFEMKNILLNEVLPKLKELNLSGSVIHKTILTTGIGESALAERIRDWEEKLPGNIKLAYLPEPGIVKLRLSCYENITGNAEKLIIQKIKALNEFAKDFIFGFGDETLQQVAGKLLINKQQSLTTAESCTGGYLAHLITSVPGSSKYFKGSVIAYENKVKTEVLGVDESLINSYGTVSKDVVIAMAERAKNLLKSDYALATSGIAGPDGGTPEKPVGTVWVALATPEYTIAEKLMLGNDRERNIIRASVYALNMLRKALV